MSRLFNALDWYIPLDKLRRTVANTPLSQMLTIKCFPPLTKCYAMHSSDGTRESSIVTKMFLVEEAMQHERNDDEMSEEFQSKHEVM